MDDKHTIEEAKKWARTIVERVHQRWHEEHRQGPCKERHFPLLRQVLTEMIQTIAVVDRIGSLADKAGLFTFDLRKLLEDYLGDVQVVTEFEAQRGKILRKFDKVMKDVNETYPEADIYIVAHSEGTVVSFIGLLQAFTGKVKPQWVDKVQGWMTLGSPIDKHLLLWPKLFPDGPPVHRALHKIEWRNYYDHGDPIGFALDDARAWVKRQGWGNVFNFSDAHDIGFSRYLFPGKAHVDYWTDKDVFKHFIDTVVNVTPGEAPGARVESSTPAPGSKWFNKSLSLVLPYLGVMGLVVLASYLLFKGITDVTDPTGLQHPSKLIIARGVAETALLMCGITLTARLPRLTRSLRWWGFACAVGYAATWGYLRLLQSVEATQPFGLALPAWFSIPWQAAALVGLVFLVSAAVPKWGMVPLMILGILVVSGTLGHEIWTIKDAAAVGPLWPAFIAFVAVFYIWWLAALLFDLVFVWHRYIHSELLLQRMDEALGGTKTRARRRGKRSASSEPTEVAT